MRLRARWGVGAATTALLALAGRASAAPPWVDRTLTRPAGDWAFDFGLGIAHAPDDTGAGINAEMAVGITRHVELGARTGVLFGGPGERSLEGANAGRLFDRQSFDEGADALVNPEVRVRGELVGDEIVELGLEGRLILPLADGTYVGAMFGVPLALHLGNRVRLDTGAYVPIVFAKHDTPVDLSIPVDVWIQATPRVWLGPMTGVRVHRLGESGSTSDVSLGLGLGYTITHALDFKTMLLFPEINHGGRLFGLGAGLQVRIE
jgi:hypothetical protein